jgi:hypothetical protein
LLYLILVTQWSVTIHKCSSQVNWLQTKNLDYSEASFGGRRSLQQSVSKSHHFFFMAFCLVKEWRHTWLMLWFRGKKKTPTWAVGFACLEDDYLSTPSSSYDHQLL